MSEQIQPDPRAWQGWATPPGVPDQRLLDLLVAAAADQATAILGGSTTAATTAATTTEDPVIDAVRLLAGGAGGAHAGTAAQLTGIPQDDLRRLVLAYRHGGTGGVSAALAATPCSSEELAAAVAEVHQRRAFTDRELTVDAGAITDTAAGVRVRRGPDGRWYPFTLARAQWWPAIGANISGGTAYQAAVRAKSLRGANN